VECPGNLKWNHAGLGRRILGQGLELFEGARGDGLACSVDICGRCAGGLDGGQDLGGIATHHGAHAGGRDGSCRGHAVGAFAHVRHGFLFGEHAGQRGRRDLAHRVPGQDDRQRAELDVEQRLGGHQPGRDNERLCDGGVFDGFLVRRGPVRSEVDACNFAQGGQMACYGGQLQPRGQETGGL
jgi:hypothetical protein